MIRCILFDLDGTLVEAKDWHYEALNRALRLFGFEISREEHINLYDGSSTRDKLKLLTEKEGLPKNLYPIISRFKQNFTYLEIEKNCKPVENVVDTLRELKSRGFLLGLCSNSIRHSIDLMLSYSGISEYFDTIVSNQDVIHAKPSPEIYETAKQWLKVTADECLVVEDNPKGVEAATRAGMQVIQVSSPKDISLDLFQPWL